MHILLTRPLEDCSEMILKFQSLGHEVSHLPLFNNLKVPTCDCCHSVGPIILKNNFLFVKLINYF
jgi:hypothetical protein